MDLISAGVILSPRIARAPIADMRSELSLLGLLPEPFAPPDFRVAMVFAFRIMAFQGPARGLQPLAGTGFTLTSTRGRKNAPLHVLKSGRQANQRLCLPP